MNVTPYFDSLRQTARALTHRARRSLLSALALCALTLSGGCGRPVTQEHRTISDRRVSSACVLRLADSSMVRAADGADIYVEAQSLVAAGESLLLAGSPNYVTPASPVRRAITPARDSVFGVIKSPAGTWTYVPKPGMVPWFSGPRALANGEGRWDVVFVQLSERNSAALTRTAIGAWHGLLSANGWERLERLPIPDGHQLEPMNSTGLLRSGETLLWATQVWRPNEVHLPATAVLLRIGGEWRYQVLDLESVGVSGYRTPAGDLRLLVEHSSQPETWKTQGTRYAVLPSLTPLDTVIASTTINRVYRRVDQSPDGTVTLTWLPLAKDSAPARVSILLGRDGEPVVSRTIAGTHSVVFRLQASADDSPWLVLGDARDSTSAGRFEMLRVAPNSQVPVASLPHRYLSAPSMALHGNQQLLLFTGPVLVGDSSEARIASLLTTVDFNCRD